jgi:integrase
MMLLQQIELRTQIAANDSTIMCNSAHKFDDALIGPKPTAIYRTTSTTGLNRQNISFAYLADKALHLETQKQKQKQITMQTLAMFVSRLRSQLLPFFGADQIQGIDQKRIAEFVAHLQKAEIKAITIKQYLGLLKRILSIALDDRSIYRLPIFPKLKIKNAPRGSFSCREYKILLKYSKILRDQELVIPTNHRITAGGLFINKETVSREMTWLIRFMVNSFVRPVDIKLIKHKHIEVIRRQNTTYLRLNLPETKNHRGQVVTLSAAKGVYEALKRYQDKRGYACPEDYVFMPEAKDRNSVIQLISKDFRKILMSSGLYYGQYGQTRSFYCLRHTAITFRLRYGNGIDLITLARNARTSVEMIEKFYSSELSAEMNIQILQSRRSI